MVEPGLLIAVVDDDLPVRTMLARVLRLANPGGRLFLWRALPGDPRTPSSSLRHHGCADARTLRLRGTRADSRCQRSCTGHLHHCQRCAGADQRTGRMRTRIAHWAGTALGTRTAVNALAPNQNESSGRRAFPPDSRSWEFAVTAIPTIVRGGANFVSGIEVADRGSLHLDARVNYESVVHARRSSAGLCPAATRSSGS